ncbi:nicotinate phosphoribosyltransferase [Gracilibacillus boraciitolerans JCM 21714]|uniref:nicotinate phosphoribosyltransferase n=1 Tax=Gracilibacillus boraciitolerans JCM 21714 TaxID=1298598 RepID=W4VK69_9BACI|nr:nicotinate phosphoribosyltransferase [Gracilibacillus boraciitolerans JCM 21714]
MDSGDMAYLSKQARYMLDDAGFSDAKIIVSNDLDEYTILNLQAQGAKIDIYGIGTKVITAYDQAALGGVYKLVAIEDNGEMVDTIKISSNPEKVTTPGSKKVYRIINNVNGHSEGDYIALENENPQTEERLKMFHPVHTYISKFVTNFTAINLHQEIVVNGVINYSNPSLKEIQQYTISNMKLLWEEYKRTMNPEEYPVDLSEACWENKMNLIRDIKSKVKKVK